MPMESCSHRVTWATSGVRRVASLFETVALAPDRDDLTVMQEAVDDGGGHDGIAADLTPCADGSFRG